MFQVAGGWIGFGAKTAIALGTSDMAEGTQNAVLTDSMPALCGAAAALFFVGGPLGQEEVAAAWPYRHRARV